MRAVLMLVITWMILSPEIVTKTQAAPARANRVSVSYVPPKNPAHQPIYDQLKGSRLPREVAKISHSVPTAAGVAGEGGGMQR